MRNIWKRAAAAVLALAMCLSFAGCYDENMTWAARKDNDTLPIGGYIYYLYSAYTEAASQVDSSTHVLDAQIDGEDAEQWIKDRALTYVKSYYYINDKMAEYGLEMTEEDQSQAENAANSLWSYYGSTFEELGIAQSSFQKAYGEYNVKSQKVMQAMYGEGGELALEDGAMKDYYTGLYYSFEYFYVPLTTTDEEGNSVDLDDSAKAELKTQLEGYVDQINDGDLTVSEASDDYSAESGTEATYQEPTAATSTGLITELYNALTSVDDGEAVLAETDSGYYVLRRLSISDYYDENIAGNEDQELNLLATMKGEEFTDYVNEQAASVEGVELNQAAMDRQKVSSLVTDSNRSGTSSASSETESSASSSSSSAESETSSESSASASSEASSEASSQASESSAAE